MLPSFPRLAGRDPHATSRTYYGSDLRQGQSLIRARRPYLVKNAITGLGIVSFAAAIYIYTIKAVAQDNFEDVQVPEAPQKPVTQTTTSAPLAK